MAKYIYLDHAATTPLDPKVLKTMLPYFTKNYGNPSSLHELGREAQQAVENSRKTIAKLLNAQPEEIIFTSGGTESINLAIKGIAFQKKKGHIITSQIEHAAVLETCKYLETKGFESTYLPVDKTGQVSPQEVEKTIRNDTVLISIHYANNEIGTIEPIAKIGKIARKHQILFHTDACQAGSLLLDVKKLNVDLLTLNGSKIYGPKGVGLLYKREGVSLEPLFHGGGQEAGFRSGTENVSGIVGLARALELVQKDKERENQKLESLRTYFVAQVKKEIPSVIINGHTTLHLSNSISLSLPGLEAETILRYLDQEKIYVSTGSACSSNQIEVSHVLKAIGLSDETTRGTVRFTLGKETTKKELKKVVRVLVKVVKSLRSVGN